MKTIFTHKIAAVEGLAYQGNIFLAARRHVERFFLGDISERPINAGQRHYVQSLVVVGPSPRAPRLASIVVELCQLEATQNHSPP